MKDSSTAIKTVPFHGHDLITIQDGETVRVAMKPICDAIGLSWSGQYERIKRHPVLSATVRVIRTVAEDGKSRELFTLPLNKLNGWLFGINATRTKPQSRDKLVEYQSECFDVLWDYWSKGVAINPRIPLSPSHQRDLQKAIASRIYAQVPKDQRPAAFKKIYSHLKDRFGVAKYDQIDESRYTEALGAVQSFELEGEWLAPDPKPEGGLHLTDYQAHNMWVIFSHLMHINRIYDHFHLYEHLTGLGSPAGIQLHDHVREGSLLARLLVKQAESELHAVRRRLDLPERGLLH